MVSGALKSVPAGWARAGFWTGGGGGGNAHARAHTHTRRVNTHTIEAVEGQAVRAAGQEKTQPHIHG